MYYNYSVEQNFFIDYNFSRDTKFNIIEKIEKIYQTPHQISKPMKIDRYHILKNLPPKGLNNKPLRKTLHFNSQILDLKKLII